MGRSKLLTSSKQGIHLKHLGLEERKGDAMGFSGPLAALEWRGRQGARLLPGGRGVCMREEGAEAQLLDQEARSSGTAGQRQEGQGVGAECPAWVRITTNSG